MTLNRQFVERMCHSLGDRIELASQVVDIISAWPTGNMLKLEQCDIERRDVPAAKEVVEILAANGVLFGSPDFWKRNSSACTLALAAALQGAAIGRRLSHDKENPVVAATMPLGVGTLGSILPDLGLQHVSLETTDTVFTEIARSAQNDFTIFAPFLNEEGVLWIRDLLTSSPAANRALIVRDWSRARHQFVPIMAELSAHNVKILDYFLQHKDGYETFHAKLLVADDTRAYVGSANFLRYRKNSLELGVMVKGHTARTIRFISEALKEISRPVLLPALAPFGPKTMVAP
jgi:hypothetical protein